MTSLARVRRICEILGMVQDNMIEEYRTTEFSDNFDMANYESLVPPSPAAPARHLHGLL